MCLCCQKQKSARQKYTASFRALTFNVKKLMVFAKKCQGSCFEIMKYSQKATYLIALYSSQRTLKNLVHFQFEKKK
jgi:hypothetical protein